MNISDSTVTDFQTEGVVVLHGVFRDWVEPLSQGVAQVMAHPSSLERSYQPKDGSAPFFQDLCNWQRVPEFRAFVFESPAAEVAARLMGSPTSRFFHDHILVKRPGNSTVTPWHQDQPYYCVEGDRTVSFWTPLDAVSRSVSLECVARSHRWNNAGYRPKRFDGSPLYADEQFEDVPDIDAQRDQLVHPRLGHGAGGRDRIRLSHHSRRAGQCLARHSTCVFIPVGRFRCALRAARCIGIAAISASDARGRRALCAPEFPLVYGQSLNE